MAGIQILVAIAVLAIFPALRDATSFDKYDAGYGIYDDGHNDKPLTDKEYIQFISYYPGLYFGSKMSRRGAVVFYRPLPIIVNANKLPLVYVQHTQVKSVGHQKASSDKSRRY